MKTIPLTQNKVATVDDSDFQWANQFSWHATKRGQRWYAARREGGKGMMHYMHRELISAPAGLDVDHEDGDGLNNQRYNLKAKTRHQNLCGFFRKKAGTTSRFLGVSWYAREGRWIAQIRIEGKNRTLGRFESEQDAADAYQKARKLRNDNLK